VSLGKGGNASPIVVDEASLSAPRRQAGRKAVETLLAFWTLGVLGLIVLGFAVTTPNFLSQNSWIAISVASTEVMIIGLGQTVVIVSGGVDLSVGAVLGASGLIGGLVMEQFGHGGPAPAVVIAIGALATVAAGVTAGVINGLVITRLAVTPFIATLGMFGVATGVANLVDNGQDISAIPAQIQNIGDTNLLKGWIPIPVLVAGVLAIIMWAVLQRTRFGRRTFAIGSNVSAARRAGIDVRRHLLIVYALSGMFAGVASFLVMAQLATASVTSGTGDELASIAIVVIGGGSLLGGRGSIGGTVIGAFIVSVLDIGLIIAGVQPYWQTIAVGLILIGAVWADQQRTRLTESTGARRFGVRAVLASVSRSGQSHD
jgi:ribose transport system permease protein